MITTRTLPRDEWPKLAHTELETVWRPMLAHAPQGEIVVAERDGEIVGCWAILPVWHVEGLWVKPDERGNASVPRRLLGAMRQAAARLGARAVATSATEPHVGDLLAKVQAQALPGQAYVWQIGGR